jgi:ribosomal protein L7Ae-like RNA K-turn-binding protein
MPRSPGEADALGLLGLAQRAGVVVTGIAETRSALGAGELALVLLARDASAAQLDKVRPLLRHREVPMRWISGRAALGHALGRGPASAAGIGAGGFAARLLELLGPDAGAPGHGEGGPERSRKKESRGSRHAGR